MKNILPVFVTLLTICACSLEKPDISSESLKPPRLVLNTAGSESIEPSLSNIALTLSWTNESKNASYIIEIADDKTFSNVYAEKIAKGVDTRSFTFREINEVMLNILGMTPDAKAYICVRVGGP